jgi:Spy/CpxP family protein refolding chaperone
MNPLRRPRVIARFELGTGRLWLSTAVCVLAALLSVATLTSVATAEPADGRRDDESSTRPGARFGYGGPPGHPAPGDFIEQHAERLGLDQQTVDAIRAVIERSRASSETLRADVSAAHGELRELLHRDTPDEAAVMQQAEKIGALETEASKNRLRAVLEIRKMLTAEQRRELDRIRREFHEQWSDRPPGGMGPHGGPPWGRKPR